MHMQIHYSSQACDKDVSKEVTAAQTQFSLQSGRTTHMVPPPPPRPEEPRSSHCCKWLQ